MKTRKTASIRDVELGGLGKEYCKADRRNLFDNCKNLTIRSWNQF
jgi:hypothetical protein